MRKIKDMAEDELCRLIAQVCYKTTDPVQQMMIAIGERFEKIEQKLQQEIQYPNAYKKYIMGEINKLNKEIEKFLKQEESKRVQIH